MKNAIDQLLRARIKKYNRVKFRNEVEKPKAGVREGTHARQRRIKKISRLLSKAQANTKRMTTDNNPEFLKYLLRLFRKYPKNRYTHTYEKGKKSGPPTCREILFFNALPESEELEPKDIMDHMLVISTETGTPQNKPGVPVSLIAMTIPEITSKGLGNLKIEILTATYCLTLGGDEFESCQIYHSKLMDDALKALADPESTITFLVEKFGDGEEVQYCR